MRIDVALFAGWPLNAASSVCIVVDTLRASSSIVSILDRGAKVVLAAGSTDEARSLSERFPGHLLCGERGGLAPEGFDFGNSPIEFSGADLADRSLILATSNGTRMLALLAPTAPAVLVGALLNRTAVAQAAVGIALPKALDITVACSGEEGGRAFAFEDALAAGAIADAIATLQPAAELSDAARLARDAFRANERDIPAAINNASHARELVESGFGQDVRYCARLDVSECVPALSRDEDGILRVSPINREI